ncbi:4-alpha-glucanotransferase [uncultured Cloacibacillus sp.]|uniref:4-alpha-glucanotransferase n=1 Tax=uncultured Cloacibacillus sp. TaxID=889794 RepID=UPI003207D8A0
MSIGRRSGVLLHVTSLPGLYGAGDFGTGARRFAEFLKEAGFSLWQLLPLTPVLPVFGHSPYSSPSAFAGNPSLVSPELLFEDGLATKAELDGCAVPSGRAADFAAASEIRARLCALAFARFKSGWYRQMTDEFEKFRAEENYWLRDYALYSLLKKKNGERCWADWPAELAARDEAALARFEAECAEELSFIEFTQFVFFRQLGALSAYCAELGVELMGDAPIYVAWDGADVWAARGLFDLEPDGRPRCVAGVPPDYFSETGQRWGNPLYRWEEMRRDGFAWWRSRLRHILKYCAVARIDHFRGLSAFWEIPAECETAKDGRWLPALGGEMLEAFRREECGGGELPLVAEDLGIITDDVRELMARFGLPGMKVLMFAFGGRVAENPYAPHNVAPRSVIYTGTHDNDTAAGWWSGSATAQERENFALYTGREVDAGNAAEIMTRMALSSTAELAVVPAQDLLGLGAECRMNRPSVPKGNWGWRLTEDEAARLRDKAPSLRALNDIYGRLRG